MSTRRTPPFSDAYRSLEKHYRVLKDEIAGLDWLTNGSVCDAKSPRLLAMNAKGKSQDGYRGALGSSVQAFKAAIANHRRLEAILREMRAIRQDGSP